MLFASPSLFTARCLSLPDLRNASSLPDSPLYFAALFLNDGPSLSAETEWHLRQPSFLAAASPASCASAPNGTASAAAAAKTMIRFIVSPFFSKPRHYTTDPSRTVSDQGLMGRASRRLGQCPMP